MVVQFTYTPIESQHTDLVGLLRPQLSDTGHGHTDAGSALLRALCVALPKGHAAVSVRRAVLSLGTPEQVSLAHARSAWARLVRTARERVAAQGSEAGQYSNALRAARITVARVTMPLTTNRLSPRREALARRAFAVAGLQLATLKFDKIVISSNWLALQLGISPETARQTVRTLIQLRWLSPAGRRGQAGRYRLRPLESEALRDHAWLHSDTVEEIAAGTYETPLAQLVAAASHAGFGYGSEPLTTQLWVTMLHVLAGITDEDTLGVSVRTRRRLLKRSGRFDPASILDNLDDYAARTGAFANRDAAEAAFRKRAADNAARLKAVRHERNELHQQRMTEREATREAPSNAPHVAELGLDPRYPRAFALLRAAVDVAGIPPIGQEIDAAQQWVRAVGEIIRAAAPTPELRHELGQLFTHRQWTEAMITSAVGYLAPEAAAQTGG